MIKFIFSCLTILMMILFLIKYVSSICRKKVVPTISTWLILLAATTFSLMTRDSTDLKSCILNVTDVLIVLIIVVMIFFQRNTKNPEIKLKFRRFEKWYLIAVVVLVLYYLISRSAYHTNVMVQALMTLGFVPTIHTVLKEKPREPLETWTLTFIAAICSLVPAGKNLLSLLYSVRSVFCTGSVLFIILIKSKKDRNRRKIQKKSSSVGLERNLPHF